MKTYLLNVAWLIMVTLFTNNLKSQITLDPNNTVELKINCDEFEEINPPMASSTCDGKLEYNFEDKVYSGGCLGTIERIWTISDNCNNSSQFQQFIKLTDTLAPELSSYPANISVSQNAIPEIPTIVAEDNCSQNLNVSFSENQILDSDGNLDKIERTWSVSDKCGNEKTHSQIITIIKSES
jgi:hypothetical protein